MKRLLASICLSVALITTPVAFQSCVTTKELPTISAQSADQIVLTAEKTAETALLAFDTLITLERHNEAMLKTLNPKIHEYANVLRRNGKNWIVQLRNATKTFQATRTPDARADLNTILATLTAAISNSNNYISQAKSAVGH